MKKIETTPQCPWCQSQADERFKEDDAIVGYKCLNDHMWPVHPFSVEKLVEVAAGFGWVLTGHPGKVDA